MTKTTFTAFFVIIFTVSLTFGGDGPGKIIPKQKVSYSEGNNFQAGVPLESPVFMDNWGPESFENFSFPPAGWARFTAANNIIAWERMTYGQLPPGWPSGFGYEVTVPPGGGTAVALATYDANGPNRNDIWLVTPKIYNVQTTDSLIFWISKKADYIDSLDIRASKTRNDTITAFSILIGRLTYPATNGDSAWVRKGFRMNASGIVNGDSLYVGFREHVFDNLTDGAIIQIDLVRGVGSSVVGSGNISGLVTNKFSLAQNYPNPFNPGTTIYYNLPKSSHVKLTVFDVLGNEVATLVDEYKLGGTHKIDFNAGWLASGVYFYKLTAGNYTEVRKMTLIK
jgi:hypothetical protein